MNGRSRTICVLGGTGFLGTCAVGHLAAAGHQLRLPTRSINRNRHLGVLPNAQLLEADVHDPATLRQLFAGCDTAINMVGILNESARDGSGFRHAHTELTRKAVAAATDARLQKFVQVSALKASASAGW